MIQLCITIHTLCIVRGRKANITIKNVIIKATLMCDCVVGVLEISFAQNIYYLQHFSIEVFRELDQECQEINYSLFMLRIR